MAYLSGAFGGGSSPAATLLLAGVAVGLFLTAVQTYILQRSAQDLQQVYSWLLGSLSGATWAQAAEIGPYALVSVAVILLHGRHLDVLSVGDEEARALGLHPGRVRLVVVAACALAAASAVAVSGLIGFVGIVVPHVVRRLAGPSYRLVLPLSLLVGAGFLVLADTLARTVVSPAELPIGVVTALVGSPVFIWILRSTRAPSARERPADPGPDRGAGSCPGAARGVLRRAQRRLARPDRAERSGQDHAAARRGRPGALPGHDRGGPGRPGHVARPRPGPSHRLRAAAPGAAAGHDGRGLRAAGPHSVHRLPGRPRPRGPGPGRCGRRPPRRGPVRGPAAGHLVRRRTPAGRAGPGPGPEPRRAAAGRAHLAAGHRAPAAGPRAGRRPAPQPGRDRAVHAARPDPGRPVRREPGAARRRTGRGGRAAGRGPDRGADRPGLRRPGHGDRRTRWPSGRHRGPAEPAS